MSVLVSFLVVTRVNIAYNRFMESASCMTHLFRNSREIVMNAISFTRLYKTQEAMDWRLELCRRVIVLLKVTVSILEYNNKRESVWTHPILRKHEQKALLASFGTAKERYPIILSVFLRTAISAHEDFGIELHVNERLRLLQNNTDYIEKYHGLMKLISTPFPFPLLQMSRVFLFAWVLTLPFAVLHDLSKIGASVFVIFFMTFGFMGLEFVAMELDDPFGNDDNDLEIFGMSQVLYEDIYIFLYDIDGSEQGQLLRQVINDPELENQVQRNYHNHVLRRETVEASPMNQQLSRDRTFSSETSNIINDSKKSMRRNNLQRHGLPNVSPRNCRSSLQLNEIVSPRNMLGPLRERRLECAESTERNTSPNNDPTPIPCPGRRRLRRTSSGFSCIITEHLNRKEDECDENIDPGDDDSVYGSPI
uniref:Bestrophin homolog n=1 Tax=Corethron hystrix TaxID=216773 RepID=A0A7S1BR48_9STRA